MVPDLSQKYAELKATAAESADMDAVGDLVVDILQLLHNQFSQAMGKQKMAYEQAYSLLDCTMSAHNATRQNTRNPYYVSEISLQVGRDIASVLPTGPGQSTQA